jgi:hypothetical protein
MRWFARFPSAWLCNGCGEKVLGALRKVSVCCDVCQQENPVLAIVIYPAFQSSPTPYGAPTAIPACERVPRSWACCDG